MGRFRAPNTLVGISLVAVIAAACTAIFSKSPDEKYRSKLVKIALKEPATSPRVQNYWKDVLSSSDYAQNAPITKDWCGVFILWALHQAGLAKKVLWKIGEGFISTEHLAKTDSPKVGDIAFFSHNQHQALIKAINGNQIELLNGNGTNGWISPSTVDRNSVTAFYSIDPFIEQMS